MTLTAIHEGNVYKTRYSTFFKHKMVISLPQTVEQILGSHQQRITMEDSTLRVLGSWHPGFPTSDDLILKIFNILKNHIFSGNAEALH